MGNKFLETIFSIKNDYKSVSLGRKHKVLCFLGIKIKFRIDPRLKETIAAKKIQDKYDLSVYINAEKVVVFIEVNAVICGGQISIFSLCKYSKAILEPKVPVLMTTMPGKYTYAHNDFFINNIDVFRWEQIIEIIKNKKEVIIHIPEYLTPLFLKNLTIKEKKILKKIKNLQINIMNQRVDIMPPKEYIDECKKLTKNITQTTAHDRYSTQQMSNKYNIPLHKFSVNLDMLQYSHLTTNNIEKIILISPDNRTKSFCINCFMNKLGKELPDYKIIRFYKMKFLDCMKLTSRCFFTISMGEGFDGYLIHPLFVGRLGAAIYNNTYFPDASWLKYRNIYEDYHQLCNDFVKDVRYFENNLDAYHELVKEQKERIMKIYDMEEYKDNLRRFYNREYDFYPQTEEGAKNAILI